MFTGIIEEVGVVSSLIRRSSFLRLSIYAKKVLQDLRNGDSISINGICLTVADMGRNNFSVDVSEETMRSSSIVLLKIGDRVNLERALLVGGRVGGHLISGHIDGVAEIKGKIKRGDGIEMQMSLPSDFMRFLVPKGSIALDGVSLTLQKVTDQGFSIMLIPQTIKTSVLAQKNIGSKVNFEIDMISKYVEKQLGGGPVSDTEKVMFNSGFLPIGIVDN
ncbi:MAG: riboflavin synthase [Candidatus Margulisiibacteriota bacterium]|nr:riboflavin synthase [Candidatus Margulisiibacteriota bacterium]